MSRQSIGILAFVLVACNSGGDEAGESMDDSGAGADPEQQLLPEPDDGFQVRSIGTVIEAGEDVEYCEVGQIPGEPGEEILYGRIESALSGYSHHLIVYAVEPGSEADDGLALGDLMPCTGTHALGAGLHAISGAQRPYQEQTFAEGVGGRLIGGQKLIWNYHHLNLSDEAVDARHAMNVHTVDELDHFVKTAAMVNQSIDIPPGEQREFTAECRFRDAVMVGGFSRHTHRWGTDFDVWFAGGDEDDEHIWKSSDFELDIRYSFDAPRRFEAGEGFRFRCGYSNTTETPLAWGNRATDEMCILFVGYWEPEPDTEVGRQSCVVPRGTTANPATGIPIPPNIDTGFD